jgi:hypothetical protein
MEGRTRLGFISYDAEQSFLRMADECIRQMEWVRKDCIACCTQADYEDYIKTFALTLAPSDWKP